MKDPNNDPTPAPSLRDRAGKRLRIPEDSELSTLAPEQTRQLLHELHVHQIELELQNEDLHRSQVELDEARARYFNLYDQAPIGYCTLSEHALILEANLTAATLLGVVRGALIKMPLTRFILKKDQDIYYQRRKQLLETRIPQAFELRMVTKNQTVFWAQLNVTVLHEFAGPPVFLVVLSDITEVKQAAMALQESENRFRRLFAQQSVANLILNAETGDIIDANQAAAQFYGWPIERLKQMCIQEINTLPPEAVEAEMEKAVRAEGSRFEFRHRRADGSIRDVEVFCNTIEIAGKNLLYSNIHDITERKRAAAEREATVDFLRLTNNSQGLEDLIREATAYFQERSGCEAVGIRLQEGEDYPYYETRGFPDEFVLAENRLCTFDEEGNPLRDSDGNPVLACMCGNIIRGRYDPARPFFTARGSFWCNGTTELLTAASETDRQSLTRNRCNGEGYESVALIPLQAGATILGLLQLNDRRKGRFSLENITLWERLAGYLAVGLAKFSADKALRRAKEEWERTFNSVPDLIAILDNRHRVLRVNEAMARRLGVTPADCVGLRCYEVVHGATCPPGVCPHMRTIADGCEHTEELHEDRLGGDFQVTTTPLYDDNGVRIGSVHIAHDITERKRAEQEIHRRAEELRVSNEELSRFNHASVGRELRMIALKKEVNAFCEKTGQAPRYPLAFEEDE